MMTDIVAVCGSFGLKVLEPETENMCVRMKRVHRVTLVTGAAGQVYKQTTKCVYLGATVWENNDHTARIKLLANLSYRRYSLPL